MSQLKSRIRRLERFRGTCTECGGEGHFVIVDLRRRWKLPQTRIATGTPVTHSLDEAASLPGCPRCGARQQIILTDPPAP